MTLEWNFAGVTCPRASATCKAFGYFARLRRADGEEFYLDGELLVDPHDGRDARLAVLAFQLRVQRLPEARAQLRHQPQAFACAREPVEVRPGFREPRGEL